MSHISLEAYEGPRPISGSTNYELTTKAKVRMTQKLNYEQRSKESGLIFLPKQLGHGMWIFGYLGLCVSSWVHIL